MRYSCDFETTTDPNDCRVWAWVAIDIDNQHERFYGNSITSFFDWIFTLKNSVAYFHNLKFDGEFILHYLLTNGFTLNEKAKELQPMQFNTLISDKLVFYTIEVVTENSSVKFIDSLKLLPFSVSAVAKGFGLSISKLEIDYNEKREIGHELTEQEKDYITNDALIIAQGLETLFDQGFKKITAGSNAFSFYKKEIGGEKKFRRLFPIPKNDEYLRKAYKGGFTYANPAYIGKRVGAGLVFDVNSLYPFSLHSPHQYPVGIPKYFTGEYNHDDNYPLYFQRFRCMFHVKQGYFPMVQLKSSRLFLPTEYVTDSEIEVEMTLTSVDLALFLEHYETENLEYIDGYKYQARSGLFDDYIDYWYNVKRDSKHNGNKAMYTLSKLMQNSLYGKFATNPITRSKWPVLVDGIVKYRLGDEEQREPIYVAVGAFCTSYARDVTIRAAQKLHDRFLYADTDSLHILGTDIPDCIEIDDYKLGAFKHEGIFTEAKYLRAKMYMENIREPQDPIGSEKWKVTGAGMTDTCKSFVNIDNFTIGSEFFGKLRPKHVKGGLILENSSFTIRG